MYYRTTNVDRLLFLRILLTRHFAILAIENWFLPKKKKYIIKTFIISLEILAIETFAKI